MANSSTFPSSLDQFTQKQEISASDRANIATYQYLLQQSTLTASQQQQLSDLTNALSDKLISASDFNHLQDAIYNTENFFLNQVESYFDNFTYVGAYNPTTTYAEWNTITYNGQSYLSLKNGNIANTPDQSPTYWALIAKQGATGATGPQGAPGIGLNFQGSYDSTKTYAVNDGVQFNGSLYACIQATSAGISPTNASYWTLAVAQGASTQLAKYENKVVIPSPQSNVQIGISQYNASSDSLLVFINSTFAKSGTDYNLDANNVSIDIIGATGATWNANTEFDFVVFKNISVTNTTGSIDGTSIQDNTIPNAALNADIKVGSLSALTTTTKTDVVSAINEVKNDITTTPINAAELGGLNPTDVVQTRVSPNLLINSNFEVVTTTATVFSDALTSYSGSTVPAPWTLQSGGSVTFGTGGATIGTTGSVLTAGNASWKPLLGSDGTTKLAVSAQVETTTPSVIPSTGIVHYGQTYLWVDAQNYYVASLLSNGGASSIYLSKNVKGTGADIAWAAITLQASTKYTVSLTLSSDGTLTASATPSGGSVVTATKVDTDLTSGFLIGIGADSGYTLSNASVTAPWANSWTIGGDSRVAWGLTQSAIGGKYSVSAVGISGVSAYAIQSNITYTIGQPYTLSLYANTVSVGSAGAYANLNDVPTGITSTTKITGTTTTQRYSFSNVANETTGNITLVIHDSGTVTFDNIQLEQGSVATPYIPQTQRFQTPVDVPSLTIKGSNIVTSVNGQTGAVTVQGYNPLTSLMAWVG